MSFVMISSIYLVTAQAKVVELNNFNADICRQTILKAGDTRPIVFMYMHDCPWAKKLRPIYEQVSNDFPNRAFFAFEFTDGSDGNDYERAKTAQECFASIPSRSPSIYVYNVITSLSDKFPGYFIGEDRMGLDGGSTREDLIKFLDLQNPNQTYSYTLAHINGR